MKRKNILSILLAMVMLLTVASSGIGSAFAEEAAAVTVETSDIDTQLNLIFEQRDKMMQKDSQNTWYYTVADLDHDGNLEFIAASLHPQDRSTNLKVWEVGKDRTGFTECGLDKDPDESFPDIMTDSTDTYHDAATDTWYYMCYDNIIISDAEVYTVKTAVNLKDGVIGYDAYAIEHTVLSNGWRNVSYTDANGIAISPDQFNAAGANAFAGAERGNTSFEWLTEEKVENLTNLVDSYRVFAGEKKATEEFPVPRPAALENQEAAQSPAPAATPVPTQTPVDTSPTYLMITKNPTNENRKTGETALFVACANAFDSLSWTFVSTDGGEYSPQSFAAGSGAQVSGEYGTTLAISNVESWMNGWGAYCTFYYKGQTARTSTAYIYVTEKKPTPEPTKEGGVLYGTVIDWNYSTVYLDLGGIAQNAIPWSICQVYGDIQYGSAATVYWEGKDAYGMMNYTWCSIEGAAPAPQPVYGSMSGLAYHDTAYTEYIVLQNGNGVTVDGWICNVIDGDYIDGCTCTVYYVDSPTENNIYQVDIYGVYIDYPEPDWGYDEDVIYWPDDDEDGWNWDEYIPEADEHNRVTCPNCGNHFSPGLPCCPVCGYTG